MTIPAWPNTLPTAALLDSYQIAQSGQPPLRTEMDGGNVRMRQRFTKRIGQVSFALVMTAAQVETLKAFVWDDLDQGSSKFTMSLRIGGSATTKTVALAEGTFAASQIGFDVWRVQLTLMVDDL
jgi:hypothetical protein